MTPRPAPDPKGYNARAGIPRLGRPSVGLSNLSNDYQGVEKMKTFGLLLVCMFTLFVSGCGTMHPIYNVTAQPVVTAPGSTAANLNDVSKAILRAGLILI